MVTATETDTETDTKEMLTNHIHPEVTMTPLKQVLRKCQGVPLGLLRDTGVTLSRVRLDLAKAKCRSQTRRARCL